MAHNQNIENTLYRYIKQLASEHNNQTEVSKAFYIFINSSEEFVVNMYNQVVNSIKI